MKITYTEHDLSGPYEVEQHVDDTLWHKIKSILHKQDTTFTPLVNTMITLRDRNGNEQQALVTRMEPQYTGDDYIKMLLVVDYFQK